MRRRQSDDQRLSAEPPVREFAARLRDLQIHAGNPSAHALEALTAQAGNRVPHATIDEKLRGVTAPKDHQVLAIVAACRRYAAENSTVLPDETADEGRWERHWMSLWREMQRARSVPRRQRVGAALAATQQATVTETVENPTTRSPHWDAMAIAIAKDLIRHLSGFHINQQLSDHLGSTLVALDVFLNRQQIADDQINTLIEKLARQVDQEFVSTSDVLELRRRLTAYLPDPLDHP